MHLFPKRDLVSRLSIGTAYPALLLTAAALLLGPCHVLWRKPNPVSFDLRRNVGIWAGIAALAHTAVGLNVHLRGRMWLYFVDERGHLRPRFIRLRKLHRRHPGHDVCPFVSALQRRFSADARSRALEIAATLGSSCSRVDGRARHRVPAN